MVRSQEYSAFLTGQATDDGHAVAFAGTHPNTFRHDIDDDGRFAFYAYVPQLAKKNYLPIL